MYSHVHLFINFTPVFVFSRVQYVHCKFTRFSEEVWSQCGLGNIATLLLCYITTLLYCYIATLHSFRAHRHHAASGEPKTRCLCSCEGAVGLDEVAINHSL